MPRFIPPEESAGPGFLLSMTAGFEEELILRLALLPALFFGLRGRLPDRARAVVAVVATGLVFSLWHALGEHPPSATFFVTRFIVPGCVMSVVWLANPSTIVAAHGTAHFLIPALFAATGP